MTQRQRTLQLLQAAGEHGVTTSTFLKAFLPRFSARLMELRQDGHVIESRRVRDGEWRYTLSGGSSPFQPGVTREAGELSAGRDAVGLTTLFDESVGRVTRNAALEDAA